MAIQCDTNYRYFSDLIEVFLGMFFILPCKTPVRELIKFRCDEISCGTHLFTLLGTRDVFDLELIKNYLCTTDPVRK